MSFFGAAPLTPTCPCPPLRRAGAIALLACLAFPLATLAQPADGLSPELRDLEGQVLTATALQRLDLAPADLKAFLAAARQVAALRETQRAEMDRITAEMVTAYGAFRAEDLQNQGFTPKVERAAAQAEQAGKEASKRFVAAVMALAAPLEARLSPAQRELLANMPKANQLGAQLPARLIEFVHKLRAVPAAEFDARKDPWVAQAIALAGERAKPGAAGAAGAAASDPARVAETLRRLRALPPGFTNADIARVLEADRPKGRLDEVRDQLDAVRQAEHPTLTGLGRLLGLPGAAAAAARRLQVDPGAPAVASGGAAGAGGAAGDDGCGCSPCVCSPCCCSPAAAQAKALFRDINLLNLMNGMNFSVDQLRTLAAVGRELPAPADPAGTAATATPPPPPADPAAAAAYQAVLLEAQAALDAGRPVPDAVMQRAHRLRNQAAARPAKDAARKRPDADALAARIESALTPEQREVLLGYNPCLIPPKNLKNPVRVGQANDNSVLLEALDRFRSIPPGRYEERRAEILERTLARIEEHVGRFPDAERAEALRRVSDVVTRARALSEADYRLQRDDFAQELGFLDRKETLKKELVDLTGGAETEIARKVKAILLDPAIVPLAEARIRQIETGAPAALKDLDSITPAPSCHDGKCAVDDDRKKGRGRE